MTSFLVLLVFLIIFDGKSAFAGVEEQKRFDGDQVLRLSPTNLAHVKLIDDLHDYGSPDDYDFWTEPPSLKYLSEHINGQKIITPHPVEVRVSKSVLHNFIDQLKAAKLPYTILIKDVQKLIDDANVENAKKEQEARKFWRTSGGKFVRPVLRRFCDYDEIVTWVDEQCRLFPNIATCHDLGITYEGRRIRYIRLSTGPGSIDNPKKLAVFVEAGIHAREWLSPATAVFIIDRFLRSPNNTSIRRLLENLDWYILPVANPDGYHFSRTRHRMWRKTRSLSRDNDGVTCYGVDANRNFDFHWSRYGSSYSRCSELFHGHAAFSEPEARAIADFILAHRHELLAYFSLHAYSQFWLLPYGHREDERPEDLDELVRVALIGTKALKRVSTAFNNNEFDSEWQCGNSLTLLQYAVSGSSMDWAKGVANVTYSYALELRPRDDPSKQDYNGFLAQEKDIEKSGIEVLAGLTSAVNAMLEKRQEQMMKLANTSTTQAASGSQTNASASFAKKLNYALSSLSTWFISIFRKQ